MCSLVIFHWCSFVGGFLPIIIICVICVLFYQVNQVDQSYQSSILLIQSIQSSAFYRYLARRRQQHSSRHSPKSDKMSLPLSLLLSVIPATGVLAKPLAVWWGGKAGIHGASSRTQRKPARNSVLTTEDTLLYGFLPSRLCENTFISPEGVDYSPGLRPGLYSASSTSFRTSWLPRDILLLFTQPPSQEGRFAGLGDGGSALQEGAVPCCVTKA